MTTIRRKCVRCGRIWISAWALNHFAHEGSDYNHPNLLALRFGICPMGQKVATEYMSSCGDCTQKDYQMSRLDNRAYTHDLGEDRS